MGLQFKYFQGYSNVINLRTDDDITRERRRIYDRWLPYLESENIVLPMASRIFNQTIESILITVQSMDSPVNVCYNQHIDYNNKINLLSNFKYLK